MAGCVIPRRQNKVGGDKPCQGHLARVIAATTKVLNLTLMTCDATIRDARFCKVEFYPFKPSRLKP